MPVFFSPVVSIIECGATHVAVGRFAGTRGRLRWEGLARDEWVANPADGATWLEKTVAALRNLPNLGSARAPAVIVLPGHLVLTKFIKAPRVDAAKRAKIALFEAQQNIPYALTDVVWGHAVTGETDAEHDVMLAAAKRDAVEVLCRAAEAAGFVPRSVVPSSLALLAAYRANVARPPASTLLIELGARTTTLLFIDSRRVFARTLTLGGQSITQQLAENQDCEFAEAEELKMSPRTAELVAPAAEAFVTRLAQEITRSALHFKRQAGAVSPERVLLTGGAARLARLGELLAAKLNVPVAMFDPLGPTEIAHAAAAAGAREHATSMASLIGAAAQVLHNGGVQVDLLPPRLRARENTRRRQPWFAAAACITAVALVPPLLYFRALEKELRAKTAAVDAEIAPLRAREAANRANLERLAQLQAEMATLQSVHDRRASWQSLLADLQDRLGRVEDVWLDRLQVLPGSDAGAPLRLAVSGRMLDKTNPLANVSPDTYRRVTELLGSLAESSFVGTVEGERFDHDQPGILRFDFVLVGKPARPL